MKLNATVSKLFLIALPLIWLASTTQTDASAAVNVDAPNAASCSQYMAPKHKVNGKMVGQEECLMQDEGVVDPEGKYHRVEIGITGTLSGWIVKAGARSNHFTSAPDFVFTQTGNQRPRYHGILRYEAAKGTSITLLYPEKGWNGKFFVMVHGVGGSFLKGTMKPWDQVFKPDKPMADVTKYEKAMLAKGYAVARSRRNADRETPGDYSAVLDDGTVWPGQNINTVPELIIDEARLVRNMLQDRLGKPVTRIYWYGHSAGAYMGLLVNYLPSDPNRDPDGKPVFNGFLDDDPGGGLFVPVLMKNGKDILFQTPQERARFIKTIVIAHQLYPAVYTEDTPWEMEIKTIPSYVSPNYLANKRFTTRMMEEKGMGAAYRSYEVKGVSHNGGELPPGGPGRHDDIQILDLSRLMDGVIDLLDNWVDKGIAPPPTMSEDSGLKSGAIDLPETACPLGVYFPYPPLHSLAGVGETGFAPFDGSALEPVDGRLMFVDMNGDGKRNRVETVTEAWRRLGLLQPNETFSRAAYVACVESTAAKLRKERFITAQVANEYIQEANTKNLPDK